MTLARPPRFVLLRDPGAADPALTGAKAARLAALAARGIRVPNGLVVTTAAGPVSATEVQAAIERMGPEAAGPFAVRSSATAEDLADASFAGQYLTVLDVAPADVPEAIERVRASASAAAVHAYAHQRDGQARIAMAVLVQPMVPATTAGVAFTADPVSGDRDTIVVSGVRGRGDHLAAGLQDGDEWQVRAGTATVRRATGALDAAIVTAVAGSAARIAATAGTPQDIEWAHDGTDVIVLQARPMSGLPPVVSWAAPAKGAFGRTFRFGEWIFEPVTPLFESWLLTTMERRLHAVHRRQIGMVAPEPLHVIVNGWYFYALNFLPVTVRGLARSLPHLLARLVRTPRRVAIVFAPTARFGARVYEEEWRNDVLPRYLAEVDAAEATVASADAPQLVALVDRLAGLAGEYFASIAVVAGYAYRAELQLAQFYRRNLAGVVDGGHLALLAGLTPPEPPPAHAVSTLDWWRPTLGELGGDPGAPVAGPSAALIARREAAERAARAALGVSGRRRAAFDRLLAEAQRTVPIREQNVRPFTRPWPVMRRAVQRLGEALAEQRVIADPDDIHFLTRSELVAALDGQAAPDLDRVAAQRRLSRAQSARLQAPAHVGPVPRLWRATLQMTGRFLGADASDPSAIARGVPASAGRATGRVRVIRDPEHGDRLQPGEILVAPLTAPAWTPLFERAAAVVTDIGSALAHASIIAREYGIPAVVGCGDATARLRDGDLVTVDGGTGTVVRALAEPR